MPEQDLLPIEHPEAAPEAKTYYELRDDHRARREAESIPNPGALVTFMGIPEGKDAYNPSGVFSVDGTRYQWARVESREAQDAVSMLFRQIDSTTFELVPEAPILPLEDPFTSWIGDTLLVGGVEIRKDEHGTVVGYRTRFYKGSNPFDIESFSCGPDDMKDIRFSSCVPNNTDKGIFVFTRPYIPEGARMVGRVAVTGITSLDEITPERFIPEHTEIVPHLFAEGEWGGVNDAYTFSNGLVGALAHVAKYDSDGKRHYAAAVFVIDPYARLCSPLTMIAERGDYPMGPVKIMSEYLDRPEMHDDLADVVFPSRLSAADGDFLQAQILTLMCGLSDAVVGILSVPNPFPDICRTYFPEHE